MAFLFLFPGVVLLIAVIPLVVGLPWIAAAHWHTRRLFEPRTRLKESNEELVWATSSSRGFFALAAASA